MDFARTRALLAASFLIACAGSASPVYGDRPGVDPTGPTPRPTPVPTPGETPKPERPFGDPIEVQPAVLSSVTVFRPRIPVGPPPTIVTPGTQITLRWSFVPDDGPDGQDSRGLDGNGLPVPAGEGGDIVLEAGIPGIGPLSGDPADYLDPTIFTDVFNEQGAVPSSLFATLDGQLGRTAWVRAFIRSFDRWERISGISFEMIDQGANVEGLTTVQAAWEQPDQVQGDAGDPWSSVEGDGYLDGYYAPQSELQLQAPGYNGNSSNDPMAMPPNPPSTETNTDVGDIRIGMRSMDGPVEPDGVSGTRLYYVFPFDADGATDMLQGEGRAQDGNIVFDADEAWNSPFTPNLLEIAAMRAIGEAIGLPATCPIYTFAAAQNQPLLQGSVMELQEGSFAPDLPIRPFPSFNFLDLQQDDIRAMNYAFGDPNENNNSFTDASTLNLQEEFDPVTGELIGVQFFDASQVDPFRPPTSRDTGVLTNTLQNRAIVVRNFGQPFPPPDDSLEVIRDRDFYRLVIPLTIPPTSEMTLTVRPVGSPYFSVGFTEVDPTVFRCDCDFDPNTMTPPCDPNDPTQVVDAQNLDNLRFVVLRLNPITGELFDVLASQEDPIPLGTPIDDLTLQNATRGGGAESATFFVIPGEYFVVVFGEDTFGTVGSAIEGQGVQRYEMTIDVEVPPVGDNPNFSFATAIDGDPSIGAGGIGRVAMTEAPSEIGGPFTGANARIAMIGAELAFGDHAVFADVPVRQVRVDSGANASSSGIASAPTLTLAASGGAPVPDEGFDGVAKPAEMVSVSVGRIDQGNPDGEFPVSLPAVYLGLFGMFDEAIRAEYGVEEAPTIIVNTYRVPSADRAANQPTALAFEAAAHMNNVLIISAAGEQGAADSDTQTCQAGGNPEQPGGRFRGSRTVTSPASAFNVMTIGATGGRTVQPSGAPGIPFAALVSDRSSKGPVDAVTGAGLQLNIRPGVDLVAPGWASVLNDPVPIDPQTGEPDPCLWFGNRQNTLLNLPTLGDDPENVTDEFVPQGGTAVAAGVVAGTAALLQSVAAQYFDDEYPEGGVSADPVVLRAILGNSAVRLPGWSNTGAAGVNAGVGTTPLNKRNSEGRIWAPLNVPNGIVATRGGQGSYDTFSGMGLVNAEQAYNLYVGEGITIDVQETDPAVATVSVVGDTSFGEPEEGGPGGAGGAGGAALALPGGGSGQFDLGGPSGGSGFGSNPGGGEGPMVVLPAGVGGGGNPPIGTPGRNPGGIGDGVLGEPFDPGSLPPGGGGGGGGGDPGEDNPASLRLFIDAQGLSDCQDNESDALLIDEINELPVFSSIAISDAEDCVEIEPRRFYLWARPEGPLQQQIWDQISINIETTDSLTIQDYRMISLSIEDGGGEVVFQRWSTVNQGTRDQPIPGTQRISNINLVANVGDGDVGVQREAPAGDPHYSEDLQATLIGWFDLVGTGDLFIEVGGGGISYEGALPEESRILFGPGGDNIFGDDDQPEVIFGDDTFQQSTLPEARFGAGTVKIEPIPVNKIGWDHGKIGQGTIEYLIDEPLVPGETFFATLAWDRAVVVPARAFLDLAGLIPGEEPSETELLNGPQYIAIELEVLEMELLQTDEFGNPEPGGLQFSRSVTEGVLNNTKFMINPISEESFYMLRVTYAGRAVLDYNPAGYTQEFINNEVSTELLTDILLPASVEFGLSWAVWDGVGLGLNTPASLSFPTPGIGTGLAMPTMENLGRLLGAFGTSRGEAGFDQAVDLNRDRKIDSEDLSLLLTGF
ncbi:MAG: S8 family serine peptidase [Phycisphaerales bacterium]